MTFSLVGRCDRTGQIGMGVTSSSLCVASRCAWVRAGVGAVASQNLTDPGLGAIGLDLLEHGRSAQEVCDMLVSGDSGHAYRQILVMDRHGDTAHHTGNSALPTVASAQGFNCIAAGNLLANTDIPSAMVAGFTASASQPLAQRILNALHAGLEAGGEERVLRSAGVIVCDSQTWPEVDLRVDMQTEPLSALQNLWSEYEPLQAGYVSRAHAPQLYVV